MIIRSDCRGEPRNTSAPKRATSNREALIDIISMAQQAKPKDIGQMEFLRAQLTARSRVVKTSPSEAAAAALLLAKSSTRANRSGGPLAKGFSMSPFSHERPGRRCGGRHAFLIERRLFWKPNRRHRVVDRVG